MGQGAGVVSGGNRERVRLSQERLTWPSTNDSNVKLPSPHFLFIEASLRRILPCTRFTWSLNLANESVLPVLPSLPSALAGCCEASRPARPGEQIKSGST